MICKTILKPWKQYLNGKVVTLYKVKKTNSRYNKESLRPELTGYTTTRFKTCTNREETIHFISKHD